MIVFLLYSFIKTAFILLTHLLDDSSFFILNLHTSLEFSICGQPHNSLLYTVQSSQTIE